jgi:hypothetical protein
MIRARAPDEHARSRISSLRWRRHSGKTALSVAIASCSSVEAIGVAWPRAVESLSADIHLNVLNNSYDHMYL